MTLKKILIANRGEIACRVTRTCGRLGIATVAVYSDADARALHVEMADEARRIGPPAPRDSYLDMDKIIAAARETGADAIHPGYGFLSENPGFAEKCARAGIVFIGPPPGAMRAMAGKSGAKALMEKAGVPLVPGYHGDAQDDETLLREAEGIGFPVLIKASAGGGGKGMRVVEDAGSFAGALAAARREAGAAFGDDRMLVEKYIASPRHVEIQVFADTHGNCVYMSERDCSVQRRHQKVLEEAPAPGLSQETREEMGKAAVAAARAIGYAGAGTVEFLLDEKERFYFMEMNTRLQVEHPVTEMITGLDLVELQIRVAEGYALPFAQEDLRISGHAFEARLYAEDPARGFLPGAGRLAHLSFPAKGARIDTGVRRGDDISIHYDPMIAKVITWGKDRETALASLARALDHTHVAGPKSNLPFLRRLARHEALAQGRISTRFIEDHAPALLPPGDPPPAEALAYAAIALAGGTRGEGWQDPWDVPTAFRIGVPEKTVFVFEHGDDALEVAVTRADGGGFDVALPGGRAAHYAACPAAVVREGGKVTVMYPGHDVELAYRDPLAAAEDTQAGAGRLAAPMPGKVVMVHARAGDKVQKGAPLVVVEAMKMEHTITAPFDGEIESVHAAVGEQVDEKKELVRFRDVS